MSSLKHRLVFCLLITAGIAQASQSIRDTQDELIAWVETRKTITETEGEWSAEKVIVEDLIKLMEIEKEKLETDIAKLEDSSDATDQLRTELNADRERLLAANKALEEVVPALETSARELLAKLPQPLAEELDPLIRRLPEPDAETRLPVSQRLLTVVGILNKIDKFNTGITTVSEIRNIGEKSVEVDTIYFGLAGAFFVSESAGYAGTGTPGPDGWVWNERPEITGQVVDLIETYEGTREATFVKLPLEVR